MGAARILPEPDHLDRLVSIIDAALLEGGWHQPHRLLMVEPDEGHPGTFRLGQRPIAEGEHPLDHLLGFSAPPAWLAMGVVCFGWAAPADSIDGQRTAPGWASQHPDRRRVRVVTLMDRSGLEHATAALEDGTVIDGPGEGAVTEALRRCLGLPTPPPAVGTVEFFAQVWLQAVLASSASRTWARVAAAHPASSWIRSRQPPTVDELVEAGRALEAVATWEELRLRTAQGGERWALLLDPELAAWMDEGMFARWVLADRPTLDELVDGLSRSASASVLRRVRRTLQEWGLEAARRRE